jgi:hypothetical protein
MYYEDLSPYVYSDYAIRYEFAADYTILNVGWLDGRHEFNTGPVSEAFLDKLFK